MKLTIKEAYNLLRTVEARLEWIKDNPDDSSIEEYENDSLWAVYQKLINFYIEDNSQGNNQIVKQAGEQVKHGSQSVADVVSSPDTQSPQSSYQSDTLSRGKKTDLPLEASSGDTSHSSIGESVDDDYALNKEGVKE